MARPIRETPILYGEDAERFVRLMQEAESISEEQRAENRRQLEERVRKAKKFITF